MSATLYVLGNGFDLAHNLPTTYRDFFYFLETIEQNKTNIPLRAKLKTQTDQLPEKIIQKIENGLRQQDTTTSRCIEVIYSVLKLNNPEETNLWHCYFKKRQRNHCSFATWIDFEKEIATLAKSVVDILSSDPSQIDYTQKICRDTMGARKEYCFPQKIAKLVTSLTYKPSNLPLKEQVDNEITLFLYNELLRYTFCFEVYLRFFVLDEYLKPDSQNSFITNLFFKNPASFVLSFNYTSTLETLYGIGPNKVHHIHGAVRDKDEFLENMDRENYQLQTQLVLGYHDEDKFQTSIDIPFLWFEKFFQRMLHKTGNKFFSWIHQQHDPIQTIIYGHSLDKTDEDFIRLIFEKSACVLVYYHRESGLPKLIANLIGIFDRSLVNEYYTSEKLVFIPIPDKAE